MTPLFLSLQPINNTFNVKVDYKNGQQHGQTTCKLS